MKKFKFTIEGNEYEVEILDQEDNLLELEVNGSKYNVELEKEVKKTKTPRLVRSKVHTSKEDSKIKSKASSGGAQVKAPLPGTIIKINVKEGDSVKMGDNLLIMEAMKMENNVLAEKAGTVTSIKVGEGDAVLQNDVLVEIA